MSEEDTQVSRGIEQLRRLHATGRIDALVAVAVGPDKDANIHLICADNWMSEGRKSDSIRLLGLITAMQTKLAAAIQEEKVKEGPQGVV